MTLTVKKPPPIGHSPKVLDFPATHGQKPVAQRSAGATEKVRLSEIIGEPKPLPVDRFRDVPPDISEARRASLLAHRDLSVVPEPVREDVRVMLETGFSEDGPLSEALKKLFSA